jgi:hypothetical protein
MSLHVMKCGYGGTTAVIVILISAGTVSKGHPQAYLYQENLLQICFCLLAVLIICYDFCAITRLVSVFRICNPMYAALHGTKLALVAAFQWQQVHTVNISSYCDIFLVSIGK